MQSRSQWTDRVRWIAVVPAAVGAFYLVLFAGLFAHAGVGEPWEPGEAEPSFYVPDRVLLPLFAGLAAVAVVGVATWVAPRFRSQVAWLAWVVGTGVVAWLFVDDDESLDAAVLGSGIAAIVCGALMALLLSRRRRPQGGEALEAS